MVIYKSQPQVSQGNALNLAFLEIEFWAKLIATYHWEPDPRADNFKCSSQTASSKESPQGSGSTAHETVIDLLRGENMQTRHFLLQQAVMAMIMMSQQYLARAWAGGFMQILFL